ncbi:endopeptidase La [Pigmentiphaga sp. NML080357]|uniref:endopeptidase La n=1 Tax=Pigmentiphaga sp. NML080357 TaxID=2008675 RepID=UPI000B410411|nr:endopeptidase La [Pigmentiphaga sp. NML080357]OVZ54302.1 endopeptidase La [Pigmentiphaga sp. NML080357]
MENEFRDRQPGQEAPGQQEGAQSAAQGASPSIALPSDALTLIPVRNLVLFPGLVAPISIGRESSVRGAQDAARANRQVGVVLQRNPEVEEPQAGDLHAIGTVSNVLRYVTTPDGAHHVICQGVQRFRIVEVLQGFPFMVARVQRFEDPEIMTSEIEARLIQLKTRSQEILQLLPQAPAELAASIQNMTSTPLLSDFIAGLMEIKPEEKQGVLETVDVIARADKVLALMAHQIEVLRISRDIDQQTKARFEDRQREVMLREQLKTIQQELGEAEGNSAELAELGERIAKAKMPEEAEKQARKELKRLESIPEASAEYSMIRTYLDWLIELPWSVSTEDRIDIAEARRILDEDHYGLDKIKRRILEYLAVRKLNPGGKSPVLCFSGPPGVGKTSLGQSIAKATGRKFVRLSLGGVHDEAEIRGHRRTYIGALPGNVIQAIHKAGSNNCVMMLDEVDKLGASVQGDPAAALLEVLDPEQHDTFRDNYLGVPFDLSKVLFIATANVLDSIPGPLRDRMEVISLPGYTEEEKAQIARRYLVPRQLEANGLRPDQCEITDAAIREVINGYTREAGVRNLEREIGSAFRHAAMSIAEGTAQHVRIDVGDVHTVLGAPRFESEIAMRTGLPGVATGLAWTPVGGDILFIEASRTPGNGKLILTGQLGEVMRESVQAALTLLKARAASLNVDPALFERNDIHVHVPAGAIPKDGPSAGVAMFVALTSLMTDTPVPSDRAMTGEISLRGLVLPVGGIKEKVLAALRAGIKTVMLPARNRKDIDDIPEESRKQLQFIFLETVEDAIRAVAPAERQGAAAVS